LRINITGGQREFDDEADPYQGDGEAAAGEDGFGGTLARQGGLTARHFVEGALTLPAMAANVPASLYNAAADLVAGEGNGFRFPNQMEAVSGLLSDAGLPEPEGATERVVGDMSQALVGAGGFLKAAQ